MLVIYNAYTSWHSIFIGYTMEPPCVVLTENYSFLKLSGFNIRLLWSQTLVYSIRIKINSRKLPVNFNIICIYHVYTMYIPCIYHVYTMYIPWIYWLTGMVYTWYILIIIFIGVPDVGTYYWLGFQMKVIPSHQSWRAVTTHLNMFSGLQFSFFAI